MQLGLIAGNGRFPFLVLDAARSMGYNVTVVAVKDEASTDLEQAATAGGSPFHWVSLGQLGILLKILGDAGISQAVFAGQIKHVKILGGMMPDMTALSVLTRLKSRNTDAILVAVADIMREKGVELTDSTALLQPMLASPGVMSARTPSESEQRDLYFAYRMADAIAGLDIGQTIAVKHQAVVAVEAMEGTDETIGRAGALAGAGVAIVKVAKPNQDMRFDVPIVGLPTIVAMQRAGASILSVDAGKTLMFDRDRMLAAANDSGIAVVGRAR